jgi:phosphoglycerate dehydrogenase-like enzyme
MVKIAVLDDWQGVARSSTDWSKLEAQAEIVFFQDAFADEAATAAGLADFDILMTMRERTAFPATLVRRLPKLKLFSMTGKRAASVDMQALAAQGVTITTTGGGDNGAATAELALLLMLAAARGLPQADASIRAGGFQAGTEPGFELDGKVLGVIGLGRLGQRMARYGAALGMEVIAWSQNLTAEAARDGGATYTPLDDLLGRADVVSLHLVLSPRSRGIIAAPQLARMKPGAILVNTSRGPLIDEPALIETLRTGRITAALDVYDREPLPADHPFRTMRNTVLTPHLGYVSRSAMRDFYQQSIENVLAYLAGAPIRVTQPGPAA